LEVALISSREKDNDYFNTAEYSNVTAYLVYHAIELFLKFVIYQDEKWNINIPFCEPEDVDYSNFTEDEIEQLKAKYSMSFEQQLKYPISDKGVTYYPITIYDTELLEKYKSKLFDLYFQIETQSK
jgi:broad specificity polyphosphatase/5'/3'-nucleotidase SurE